jgi:hypothetical protein
VTVGETALHQFGVRTGQRMASKIARPEIELPGTAAGGADQPVAGRVEVKPTRAGQRGERTLLLVEQRQLASVLDGQQPRCGCATTREAR